MLVYQNKYYLCTIVLRHKPISARVGMIYLVVLDAYKRLIAMVSPLLPLKTFRPSSHTLRGRFWRSFFMPQLLHSVFKSSYTRRAANSQTKSGGWVTNKQKGESQALSENLSTWYFIIFFLTFLFNSKGYRRYCQPEQSQLKKALLYSLNYEGIKVYYV